MGSLDGGELTMSRGHVGVGNAFGGKGLITIWMKDMYVWITRGC